MILGARRRGRGRSAGRDSVVEGEGFSAVYFLLPLDAPLSIPDKSIIRSLERPPERPGFEDDYLMVERGDGGRLLGCRVSCCFHQVTITQVDAAQCAAFEAARVAFASPHAGDAPSAAPSHPAVVTVAEVAVRLAGRSDDAIRCALEIAIEFVAGVQRAYSALAKEPMAIMTRARLPLLVPHVVRDGISAAAQSDWPEGAELDVLMPRAPSVAECMSIPITECPAVYAMDDLEHAMEPVLGGPFRHAHESWRNAGVAFGQGDFAVAAILAGVTCEATIRALLLCLLWESGAEPGKAAAVLYDSKGKTKNVQAVLGELMRRVSLAAEADNAARAAAMSVLELRNRILHRSHTPTDDETRAAIDRCAQFGAWTRDATLANLDCYTVTAALSVSRPKLDADTVARLDEALTSNMWPTEPSENVRNYQFEIDRHLPGNEAMRERRVRALHDASWESCSLVYPDGTTRWFCLDVATMLACVAKAPTALSERDRHQLRDQAASTAAVIDEFGHRPTIVAKWSHIVLEPLADEPYLHSWYKISPVVRAGRYATCPTPHIPPDTPPPVP